MLLQLQFLANGLITGILYSLIAIGFALVYNTTRIFHMAMAGIYVFAAYMFWYFVVEIGLSIISAVIISIVLTMLLSLMSELCVYRPLKNKKASLNVVMIASIGLMMIILNTLILVFGSETKVIDNKILKTFIIWGIKITTPQMYQSIIGIVSLWIFFFILNKSNWGLRLKALSADEKLFEALGYNTDTTRMVVFLASGAFIAITSCLTVYDVGLEPNMGMNVLIYAFVSMIIGGVGKFETCIIGGLALGLLQSITVCFFSPNWQNAITFITLLVFLFLRPQGILGYKQRQV